MITCGFFNSVNKDRLYDARDFSRVFDGIINDGVYMGFGEHLVVTPLNPPSLTVSVGTGRAWFNHTWTYNDSAYQLTLDQTFDGRCDAIVLQIDTTEAVRANKIYIKKGTEGSPTIKPTMVNDNGVYEHPLAYVTVPTSGQITAANIENAIGTSATPYVTGIIETINIDSLVAEWTAQWNEYIVDHENDLDAWIADFEAELTAWKEGFESSRESAFDVWFQHMKDQLSEDAAGHLQQEIDSLIADTDDRFDDLDKRKQNNEKIVSYTILASGWSDNVYSFESVYPSSSWDIVGIYTNSSSTEDMRDAWASADCGGYEPTNIIRAHNDAPTIDIIVTLVLRYKTPNAIVPQPQP